MTAKDIKTLFLAIRHNDSKAVTNLLAAQPALVNATAKAPPKKDDGQSPLQVAFKIGDFSIAEILIHHGADVNFMDVSAVNAWNTPVLHDCIKAVLFQVQTMRKDTAAFERGFATLQLMLNKGADPNGVDSYGNNCLLRAFLDARQMIDHPNFDTGSQTLHQARRVFKALLDAGADVNKPEGDENKLLYFIDNYDFGKYNLLG
ncbi:ankyrin repeat domain-containing protein [Flavobacterium akiainvivens]|uniref:ankyrin repeat domain-containing protein n=1 Tax=Flavobacterium akiainvivens TaxID=1202724 RepID=UPI0006C8CDD5|nr:ankyrin repeat domain-containing protein [Flavobacterium akiainvivens]SFQ73255.1 Ankyrin repeat-containing protein [Flavobacterium akiainvivens]